VTESKIELTERWRREGNWPAAMEFKEQALQPHPAGQPDREPRPGGTPLRSVSHRVVFRNVRDNE